ncbi:MAG: Uncharacterised protein [SAR116 cluster bacterium]|nr:MAG: Uncharacterised protein [SAR116 cluster bacterium]
MKHFLFFFCFLTVMSCTNTSENELNFFTLSHSVSPIDGGSILLSESPPFYKDSQISITAVPASNYKFSHWTGDLNGTEESQSLLINSDKSFTAQFTPLDDFASDHIAFYDASLMDTSGYIFMMENGQNQAYLVNHEGEKLQEWSFESRFGNDLEITNNGEFLGCFKVEQPYFSFGGFGGHVKKLDLNGNLLWEYVVNTENEIAHHDATELPNGHILIMVWERITQEELSSVGIIVGHDAFLEKLIEVNPQTDEVVWQWRSWEHIVQDVDPAKAAYGLLSEHPNKINIAYNDLENGDWMHANGIFYDSSTDVIYMSVNFYSEVWVIDHSTTTQEAATNKGGQFNRGGDLVYRFGNPITFGGEASTRFLFKNHHPSVVPNSYPGAGNFLIYNNGSNNEQSIAYELSLPAFSETSMQNYTAPQSIWSFTDPNMYFDKISGLVRLPNGNTLICEGDYGYWEVTTSGEVVWKYDGLGKSFWRGYFYTKTDPRLRNLDLENKN